MATIGQTLKQARERKKVTASQAALATRMKIQHVEAMERDDFSRMAAPMYAKGFLRLYAEYLGLDPAPLIREYTELCAPKERAPLMPADGSAAPATPPGEKPPPKPPFDWTPILAALKKYGRPVVLAAAVVLVAIFALLGVAKCTKRAASEKPAPAEAAERSGTVPVIKEPPAPYLDDTQPARPTTP